ncbi:hypothetical protein [Bradyrhizobium sp. UNPA324]|uniref:hypothetical protein n=1 Tax=Bradyrhizobium sp. UNPA324 TaxID=1141174 RepID=UPI00114E918E|nr:hypothetical protein [Bradyrhizobium sp. UNPA324]TQF29755.1 hypothetical protein UNPA324_09110 [Bradyrhizobium sp. UNPA324]
MDRSEIINLGKSLGATTTSWLAERARSGFDESLLSEALLVIPLFEFLRRDPRWRISGEWCEWKLAGLNRGDVNIDLYAEGKAEKLFLEFKLLKEKNLNDQRLIKDMVKLALPKRPEDIRLLVVAHPPSGQTKQLSKSTLLREIDAAGKPIKFHLTRRDGVAPLVNSDRRTHALSDKEGRHVDRIIRCDPDAAKFVVEHIASERDSEFLASVYSISRTIVRGSATLVSPSHIENFT